MKTLAVGILLLYSLGSWAAASTAKTASKAQLYTFISDFEIQRSADQLRINVINVNGDQISEFPKIKSQENSGFEKYSFHNPFIEANVESLQIYDLYLFKGLKASFIDNKDSSSLEDSFADVTFDVFILIDRASGRAVKSKTDIYLGKRLIASGDVENNKLLKLTTDKTTSLSGLKLKTLRVQSNLLGSHKRTFDLVLQGIQSSRPIEQVMRLSLSNVSKISVSENENLEETKKIQDSLIKDKEVIEGIVE